MCFGNLKELSQYKRFKTIEIFKKIIAKYVLVQKAINKKYLSYVQTKKTNTHAHILNDFITINILPGSNRHQGIMFNNQPTSVKPQMLCIACAIICRHPRYKIRLYLMPSGPD